MRRPSRRVERAISGSSATETTASCHWNHAITPTMPASTRTLLMSGTSAVAAKRCGRDFVGFELNREYCALIEQRLAAEAQLQARAASL